MNDGYMLEYDAIDIVYDVPEEVHSEKPQKVHSEKPLILDGYYTIVFTDGEERTLRVRTQAMEKNFHPGEQIISFLSGPDNHSNYTDFAFITLEGKLSVWKRFQSGHSLVVSAANVLVYGGSDIRHEAMLRSGHCVRCGRLLTRSESILDGIGPECAKKN